MATAVATRALCKRYGDLVAVDGLDLEVAAGEVFAMLGPNGAGKTTTVEILEGLRPRTSGEVTVLGTDPQAADATFRSRVGIVFQSTAVFDELTVREVVSHFAGFYPAPLPPDRVIDMIGLSEKRHERCSRLSGGQKRKVDLALGMVGNPELLFLDEPTTGLDPQARRQLWQVVRDFAALGKTVLLTTHYLEEAAELADRVAIIIRGRLAEVAPPDRVGGELRRTSTVSFRREGPLAGVPLPGLANMTETRDVVQVLTETPTATVALLARWAQQHGVTELPGLQVRRKSLEDVYLEMVGAPTLEDAE